MSACAALKSDIDEAVEIRDGVQTHEAVIAHLIEGRYQCTISADDSVMASLSDLCRSLSA